MLRRAFGAMALPGEEIPNNANEIYNNPQLVGLENWVGHIEPFQAQALGIPMPDDLTTPTDMVAIMVGLIMAARSAANFIWNIGMRLTEVINRINHIQIAISTLAKRADAMETKSSGGFSGDRGYPYIDKLGLEKSGFRLWHERLLMN